VSELFEQLNEMLRIAKRRPIPVNNLLLESFNFFIILVFLLFDCVYYLYYLSSENHFTFEIMLNIAFALADCFSALVVNQLFHCEVEYPWS
jgi:hypothetical protein